MSLWTCPEHGLYGGQIHCPTCGKNGSYTTVAPSDDGLVERGAVTLAAAAIVDIWMGGSQDWRERLDDSDFLESADWTRAVEEAAAAIEAAGVTALKSQVAVLREALLRKIKCDFYCVEAECVDPRGPNCACYAEFSQALSDLAQPTKEDSRG
jgi:hypothetical protein